MQIGEVIRTHRKKKGMTQEEAAKRLGVTAPAVNKWENGNSMPDIMLLAPIARLLEVSLEELLSFREDLTEQEINAYVEEIVAAVKEKGLRAAFACAKKYLQQYPGCEGLSLWMGQLFCSYRTLGEAAALLNQGPAAETEADGKESAQERKPLTEAEWQEIDDFVCDCLELALKSTDEKTRWSAADAFYHFYFNREQYEKAEEYLNCFSVQNPDRKRLTARIYEKTGRKEEACRAYEELLFQAFQRNSVVLYALSRLAMEEQDFELAEYYCKKQAELAQLFEMGKYQASAPFLELAVAGKDKKKALAVIKEMLESVREMDGFRRARLYAHMTFQEEKEEVRKQLEESVKYCFRTDPQFAFLQGEAEWKELFPEG